MDSSIEAAASSLATLTGQYQTVTHNMANASTVGFKRRIEAVTQSLADLQAGASAGTLTGSSFIDFTQGSLVHTGRPLDLALKGKGFFAIETQAGPLYTRDGVFQVDAQGQLVDSAGQIVGGEGGPIVIPPDVDVSRVSVATDGQITAAGQVVGKLRIVEFEDILGLASAGKNCFRAPEAVTPSQSETSSVYQGFQEASNVSIVEELVDLITVTRMYEANLKTISAQDDRMSSLLQVVMG